MCVCVCMHVLCIYVLKRRMHARLSVHYSICVCMYVRLCHYSYPCVTCCVCTLAYMRACNQTTDIQFTTTCLLRMAYTNRDMCMRMCVCTCACVLHMHVCACACAHMSTPLPVCPRRLTSTALDMHVCLPWRVKSAVHAPRTEVLGASAATTPLCHQNNAMLLCHYLEALHHAQTCFAHRQQRHHTSSCTCVFMCIYTS